MQFTSYENNFILVYKAFSAQKAWGVPKTLLGFLYFSVWRLRAE